MEKMNEIHQYVRDANRNPIGVLAAVEVNGVVGIGASMCNPHDKFNVKIGLIKAIGRAEAGVVNKKNKKMPYRVPSCVEDQFKVRTMKFFKDKQVIMDFE